MKSYINIQKNIEYFDKINTSVKVNETSVFVNDAPNYCIVISKKINF